MLKKILGTYVCPRDGSPLTLNDVREENGKVVSGTLVSSNGVEYSIRNGIPDLIFPHIDNTQDKEEVFVRKVCVQPKYVSIKSTAQNKKSCESNPVFVFALFYIFSSTKLIGIFRHEVQNPKNEKQKQKKTIKQTQQKTRIDIFGRSSNCKAILQIRNPHRS